MTFQKYSQNISTNPHLAISKKLNPKRESDLETEVTSRFSITIQVIELFGKVVNTLDYVSTSFRRLIVMLGGLSGTLEVGEAAKEALEDVRRYGDFSYSIIPDEEGRSHRFESIKDLFVGTIRDAARNSIKWGKATEVNVRYGNFTSLTETEQLRYMKNIGIRDPTEIKFYIMVEDNGTGVDPEQALAMTRYTNDHSLTETTSFSEREGQEGGQGTNDLKTFISFHNARYLIERKGGGGTRAALFFKDTKLF